MAAIFDAILKFICIPQVVKSVCTGHLFNSAYSTTYNCLLFDHSDDIYEDRETGINFDSFSRGHGRNFNHRVSCRSLPDIDFSKWKEKPPHDFFK